MLQLPVELRGQDRRVDERGDSEVAGAAVVGREGARDSGGVAHRELPRVHLREFLEIVLGEVEAEGEEQL